MYIHSVGMQSCKYVVYQSGEYTVLYSRHRNVHQTVVRMYCRCVIVIGILVLGKGGLHPYICTYTRYTFLFTVHFVHL